MVAHTPARPAEARLLLCWKLYEVLFDYFRCYCFQNYSHQLELNYSAGGVEKYFCKNDQTYIENYKDCIILKLTPIISNEISLRYEKQTKSKKLLVVRYINQQIIL